MLVISFKNTSLKLKSNLETIIRMHNYLMRTMDTFPSSSLKIYLHRKTKLKVCTVITILNHFCRSKRHISLP